MNPNSFASGDRTYCPMIYHLGLCNWTEIYSSKSCFTKIGLTKPKDYALKMCKFANRHMFIS